METYTFIDGPFITGLLDEFGKEINADLMPLFQVRWMPDAGKRVFWFDSLPVKRKNQSDEQSASEIARKQEFFSKIEREQGVFVRSGVARYRSREARREQKGVDILLAIEALQCAYKGLADEVVVFTSDLDFYPLFEALQATRSRGTLRYQASRTSDDLIRSADIAQEITLSEVMSWCGIGPGAGQSNEWLARFCPVELDDFESCYELEHDSGLVGGIYLHKSTGDIWTIVTERQRASIGCHAQKSALLALERLRRYKFRKEDLSYNKIADIKKRVDQARTLTA